MSPLNKYKGSRFIGRTHKSMLAAYSAQKYVKDDLKDRFNSINNIETKKELINTVKEHKQKVKEALKIVAPRVMRFESKLNKIRRELGE